jgi:hypothetical protein
MATDPLPPNERETWIQKNAAKLREVLDDPATRNRVVQLLNGDETSNDDETT